MTRFRGWIALGAVYGFVAVGAAAGAAHLADGRLLAARQVTATALASAVQMNGWHALALIACGIMGGSAFTHAAAACFAAGVVLFSGSVYAGLFGLALGPLAPVGGSLLLLGWLLFGVSALRR